jgi:hypothetical protein
MMQGLLLAPGEESTGVTCRVLLSLNKEKEHNVGISLGEFILT